MCFVFIWEQTATCATYSINWLVFITEMKSVYYAVRTGSLTFYSLLVTWCTTSLTFNNCTLCPHCIYVFCIYLRTNSDLCHLQHKLIGFYSRDEKRGMDWVFNPLKPELNPICYFLALLGAHHFLHISRIRVKWLTFRLLMSYIHIWSTHSWCF